MPRVQCAFCGLPFSVRTVHAGAAHYCCSGCALASRIPMQGDNLPVSRGLVLALAFAFGLFNQLLFAVAGTAVAAEGRPDIGATWTLVSLLVGAALALANVGFLLTARARHWTDGVTALLAAAGGTWAIVRGVRHGVPAAVWPAVAANLLLGLWWSRGWLRRYLARWNNRG